LLVEKLTPRISSVPPLSTSKKLYVSLYVPAVEDLSHRIIGSGEYILETQLRMSSSDVQIEDFVLQNIAFTGKATFADNNSYIKNLVADNIQGSSGATNGQFLKIVSPIGKFAQTRGPNLFKILKDGLTLDLISVKLKSVKYTAPFRLKGQHV
jgi:hypothetical protein